MTIAFGQHKLILMFYEAGTGRVKGILLIFLNKQKIIAFVIIIDGDS